MESGFGTPKRRARHSYRGVAEEEDLQITALREELMKEIESVRGDLKSIRTGQTITWIALGVFVGLCSLIIGALALAANIF